MAMLENDYPKLWFLKYKYYSSPDGTDPLGKRMAFWMVPMTGIAFAYPSVTYISTRLRGKDDPFNHAMGALSTMPIIKVWWKFPFSACFQVSCLLVWCAVFLKGFRGQDAKPLDKYALRPLAHPQYQY